MSSSDHPENSDEERRREARITRPVVLRYVRTGTIDDVPVAVTCFKTLSGRTVLLSLTTSITRELILGLLQMLDNSGDVIARHLYRNYFKSGDWPDPKTWGLRDAKRLHGKNRRALQPSINASCPGQRIDEREVWRLIQMIRHAPDHATFLRLIGAQDEQIVEAPPAPECTRKMRKRGPKSTRKPDSA